MVICIIIRFLAILIISITLTSCNRNNEHADVYNEHPYTSQTTANEIITTSVTTDTEPPPTTITTQSTVCDDIPKETTTTSTAVTTTQPISFSSTTTVSTETETQVQTTSTYLTPTTTSASTTVSTTQETTTQAPVVIIGSSQTTTSSAIINEETPDKLYSYTFGKVKITNSQIALNGSLFSNLNTFIAKYPRVSGIYAINLNDGMAFSYNADKYIFAASAVKLPFMYYCMDKIQSGQYKLTDTVLYKESFRRGGTGLLQYYKSGTYWSIKTLIEYTIIYSDNVAYYMLLDHFGYSGYNQMLSKDGFDTYLNSSIKFGNVSPKLLAFYWQKIYNAYQKNPELWKTIVNSGCQTTYSPIRDKIPDTAISNKTGWSTASYHDSAIVFKDNDYIVVVMTTGEGYTSDYNYVCNVAGEIDKIIESYNSRKES